MKKIFFDMDNTFVNLYEVKGWLEDIQNENVRPYKIAEPKFRMCDFAKAIHKCQANGYEVGIITWLAKNGRKEYNEAVTEAKLEWLRVHLPSVQFDEVHIVEYGVCKANFGDIGDYLFDDEVQNREHWNGEAFDVHDILEVMRELV